MKTIILAIIIIVIGFFGYKYFVSQKNIDTVINNVNTGIDTAVTSALKGVGAVAPIYYLQNRSYGVSATQNICRDSTSTSSLGSIVADIQSYTKMVSCVVDSDFPSRSFTIIAPSKANAGQYFCTDQSGVLNLIPSIAVGSAFKEGIKCK